MLAALAAYHNSFSVPFLLDDQSSIVDNPTIRQIWPPWGALTPPRGDGLTVEGRPLVNFSLAVNYAISGAQVWSYHAVNLAIHALAGLTLFGIIRRTLLLPSASPPGSSLRAAALSLALLTAILWVVHPLQTESVTYIVQRAESLMGLCYLLTLYCFIRGVHAPSPARWFVISISVCLLGMAAKEVMVSAPLMALLYDRTFVAGTFREAWQRRWRFYSALAGTWLLLVGLVAEAGSRGGTIGADSGAPWWAFAITQWRAVALYLRLALWPSPLIFDYGTDFVRSAGEIAPYVLLDLVLLALTVVGLRRRPALGFLGAWFFVILAPSSSLVGGTRQMLAEHRVYLSLAAVVTLAVLGLFALLGRRGGWWVGVVLVLALGWIAVQRNQDFLSARTIWTDTVAKRPSNPWAHGNLGTVLLSAGRVTEAMGQFEQALQLKPDYAEAHNNLGNALLRQGRLPAAISQYEAALRVRPNYADAQNNFANALLQANRIPEAISHFREALRLDPDQAEGHNNLGNALLHAGRGPEALAQYAEALRLDPGYAAAHNNLGNALRRDGRLPEAVAHYEAALRLNPAYPEAHYNLGNALADLGREEEAVGHYRQALALQPDYAAAHNNLGIALQKLGRIPEAVEQFEVALRLEPGQAATHYNLANALLKLGRVAEAIGHDEEALRLQPDFPEARQVLARLRATQ